MVSGVSYSPFKNLRNCNIPSLVLGNDLTTLLGIKVLGRTAIAWPPDRISLIIFSVTVSLKVAPL